MTSLRTLAVIIALAAPASPAMADGLLDKLSRGAAKAGDAVEKGVSDVGDSIKSTSDLVGGEATPQETRGKIDAMAAASLDRLFSENPAARDLFDRSAGYAVFDSRRIAVAGVAAGYGRGVAVSRGSGSRTYMKMGTGGIGVSLGLGGFETQVVILFEDDLAFSSFTRNGFDATAETGAMFGEDTAGEALRFVDGRSFFVLTRNGWKVSASVAGTKYWADQALN